jgi:hypothetical protein
MNRPAGNFRSTIFLLTGICLLAALMPLADFDLDGFLDSFITDGLLLVPNLFSVFSLVFLLTKLPAAYLAAPRHFSALIVTPPNIF